MATPTTDPDKACRYATYLDYLCAIEKKWPEYKLFREYLENISYVEESARIIEISQDGKIVKECCYTTGCDGSSVSLEEFTMTLQSTPPEIRTRVVTLEPGIRSSTERISAELINVVGLTLDIEPLFFWKFILGIEVDVSGNDTHELPSSHAIEAFDVPRSIPMEPSFLDVGRGSCAKIIKNAPICGVATPMTIGR